jgi:hypothetical protein
MPTPEELEAAAGISPAGEDDRKRIWAAAQALASLQQRGPGSNDLRVAQRVLSAAGAISREHLDRGLGRAVITLQDSEAGDGEVEIGVEFSPELEEVGEGEVRGTPAQLLALEVLESSFGDEAQPQDAA